MFNRNAVESNEKKDTQTMSSNPQTSDNNKDKPESQDSAQNTAQTVMPGQRPVDIPGTTRPGQPTPPAQRSYAPGGYPGAPSYGAANMPETATSRSEGRKLVIGEGITMSGEIEACEYVVVEGKVEAALKGARILEISETGIFNGSVEIEEATVAGRFEGDLTVNGRLTIRSTGSITGTISYKELAVEAGATLDGKVSPLSAKAAKSASTSSSSSSSKKSDSGTSRGNELPFGSKAAAE